MAENKKSFLLYCDQIHTVELLEDDVAGRLFKTILQYVNDLDPKPEELILKIAFEPIKRQLKRDLKDWEESLTKRSDAGILGNLKRWHLDIYNNVASGKITLDQAVELTKNHKVSHTDKLPSSAIPIVANIADTVTVTVNDTVTVSNSINSNNGEHWDSIKKKWLSGFAWKEKVCRDFEILMPEVEKQMLEFLSGIELKEDYKNIQGLKSHFVNWYKKHKINGSSANQRNTTTGSTKLGTSDARTEALRKW